MRIAFFADNFYPELSGIVDSILTTGQELKKLGHEVCYVGPRYTKREYDIARREYPQCPEDDQYQGLPFVRLPSLPLPYSPTGQSRLALPTGASFAYLDTFKPDIIHTHSPYGTGFEALRAAKRYGVPLVGTNHTPIEAYYPFAPEMMRKYDAWYYNHCAFVSTPYQELIDRMREKGFTRPARALSNPVDLSHYAHKTPSERAAIKESLGLIGPVVLYCGRLSADKRIDDVVRATAKLVPMVQDITLVIVGHGAHGPALHRLVKELGIQKHVRFAGFQHPKELARYYFAADAFAIMSTSDSQSLCLMQAFAAGIPAVGARAKGIAHYLTPACGYQVRPADAEECAERLRELLHDSGLRERLGAGARAHVEQFSPAHIAAQWQEIYKGVC